MEKEHRIFFHAGSIEGLRRLQAGDEEDFHKDKPLYAALVPDEIWKGSHFERKFVTPFGKAWQSLAVAVGKTYHRQCGQEVKVEGLVGKESLRRIQEVMEKVYLSGKYRKITKTEACRIQGFPADYKLPPSRPRWMKLIGNSVAVPVVRMLAEAVVRTGVFDSQESVVKPKRKTNRQLNFLSSFG